VRICTLLGSCVAACIRDPIARVGGMNHFLLPEGAAGSTSLSYGVNAMELLINDLLRRGARRDKLEAKLFGGGRILRGVSDVGAKNAEFAQRFLADEGIAYIGGSLGGLSARKIEYWPHSGRVRQQLLERAEDVFEAEVAAPAPAAEADGGLELF
jgi:chemotaxis protein CheD